MVLPHGWTRWRLVFPMMLHGLAHNDIEDEFDDDEVDAQ
jgi:hypothetical protein